MDDVLQVKITLLGEKYQLDGYMMNAQDLGFSEDVDPVSFWVEVVSQAESAIDSGEAKAW